MYCGHEILADTVDEIIELAIAHAKAEHGFTEELILPVTIAVWRRWIHDLPDAGQAALT